MTMKFVSRRSFLRNGTLLAAATTASPMLWASEGGEIPMPKTANALESALDGYISKYMQVMNAPGLTLGLTDAHATLRTAGYGYADVELKVPVNVEHRFQIGSITKSFVALVILQLHEEGKLELTAPVLDYLPWLPIEEAYGTITVHHLLTHSAGLPDGDPVFTSNPNTRVMQGFKPGEHFSYSNTGYGILGLLVRKLDGRSWRESVTARILEPLEMHETYGVITTANRDQAATGYWPYWDDQVYPRQGKLAVGPNLSMDDTAGCIQSTPGDMARYMRMMLNRGMGDKKRIVSEESFTQFSTPHIKTENVFGPDAHYGYGIAMKTVDGHKVLLHTGGMESFASSITVDLDGQVAAFASINAMQGYRPSAVTEYALLLLNAQRDGKALPEPPALEDALEVKNAGDYAGSYANIKGEKMNFIAEGERLFVLHGAEKIALEATGEDVFVSTRAGVLAEFEFRFGRKKADVAAKQEPASTAAAQEAQPKAAVCEVSYGPAWFVNESYSGPRRFSTPENYTAYIGRYAVNSLFSFGSVRVYALKGELYIDGTRVLEMGGNLFRPAVNDWSPERYEFLHVYDGMARVLKAEGAEMVRVEVD